MTPKPTTRPKFDVLAGLRRVPLYESTQDFVSRVWAAFALKSAPQDISTPVFKKLIRQGYDTGHWHTSASAVDAACISKDGDIFPLKDIVRGLRYNAPIYETTHVACKCYVECTSTKKPKLPPVMVSAFGIVQ